MIINEKILSQPTLLLNASGSNVAVILLTITNLSDVNKTVDLYVVSNGKTFPTYDPRTGVLLSGDEETTFLKEKVVTSKNSLILNFEKLLLAPGDSIYARCIEDDTSLVATISAEVY